MKCKYCGSEDIEVATRMVVSMPFSYYNKLTKAKMRSKDFKVWSVFWDDASLVCKKCGNLLNPIEETVLPEKEIWDNIHLLSDIRARYSLFDKEGSQRYHALSLAIAALKNSLRRSE